MKDMWKTRKAPIPLSFEFSLASVTPTVPNNDQKVWSLAENFAMFSDSLNRLSKRVLELKETGQSSLLSFDKDDDDTLDFVAASANIRSIIFGIDVQTKFDIKQMAGNIIPAIATTNAITAGLCVMQALKVLKKQISDAKMVFLSMSTDRGLTTESLSAPNTLCQVCGVTRVDFECDITKTQLGDLINRVLRDVFEYNDSISLLHEKLIYDEDYDDNLESPLARLGIKDGSFLTVIDDSDESQARRINLVLQIKNRLQGDSELPFFIPDRVDIPVRPAQPPSLDSLVLSGTDAVRKSDGDHSRKRKADDGPDSGLLEKESNKKIKAADEVIVIDDGYIEID
ncbi:hypothetical protein AA313_de0201833 [Arthrobotrys entomopaga]|nr:hypothetical protein AA313_de0201833 [Arthrobotrys entomopaga]